MPNRRHRSLSQRKRLLLALASFLLSIAAVWLLYIASDKINHRPNGFIRLVPPHMATPAKLLNIRYNSYYIAGATATHIYLGNATAATLLLRMNYDLSDTAYLRLTMSPGTSLQGPAMVSVDTPDVYMMEGTQGALLHASLNDLTLHRLPDGKRQFFNARPLSGASFILRMYDSAWHQNILAKRTLDTSYLLPRTPVLEKQIDGVFCTDGSLLYQPGSNRLVYVYYYRNQFLCMDTNLVVQYKGRTIDTVSHANIKVASLTALGKTTLSTPGAVVNRMSCMDDKWVYVNSKLMANNEKKREFDKVSVVDVYSLRDGSYHFSFYLPNLENGKMRSFRVFNKTLIALYDHYAYTFHLNF
ncbi:hypothetical protein F0L74_23735 [Chitinophaga agrisoli]|uniref:Uncharacterized protein n=1 Tax=Chitinophaga agrisoli TaxID=2607653 RepID=A0A5B2VJH1_9BACT|nr:hypothetical protein [Chitinophaga agrisoli]KAA2239221.1 hypothetical protein F0L74_23735 [Chitinophaga agrisoli]